MLLEVIMGFLSSAMGPSSSLLLPGFDQAGQCQHSFACWSVRFRYIHDFLSVIYHCAWSHWPIDTSTFMPAVISSELSCTLSDPNSHGCRDCEPFWHYDYDYEPLSLSGINSDIQPLCEVLHYSCLAQTFDPWQGPLQSFGCDLWTVSDQCHLINVRDVSH